MTISGSDRTAPLGVAEPSTFAAALDRLRVAVEQLQQTITGYAERSGPVVDAQAGTDAIGGGDIAAARSSGCGCGGSTTAAGGAAALEPELQGAAGAPAATVQQMSGAAGAPAATVQEMSGAAAAPPMRPIDPYSDGGVRYEPKQEPEKKKSSKKKAKSSDAAEKFDLPRDNRRGIEKAIAWARKQAKDPSEDWYRRCLGFVAHAFGWNASNVMYAIDHWDTAKKSMKHPGDRNPPPGALVYWKTGSRAGHVALSLGDGKVASNDIRRPGKIDIVSISEIDRKWGAKYVGWTDPYFPKAV